MLNISVYIQLFWYIFINLFCVAFYFLIFCIRYFCCYCLFCFVFCVASVSCYNDVCFVRVFVINLMTKWRVLFINWARQMAYLLLAEILMQYIQYFVMIFTVRILHKGVSDVRQRVVFYFNDNLFICRVFVKMTTFNIWCCMFVILISEMFAVFN